MNQSLILLLTAISHVFANRNESAIAEYVSLAAVLLESGQEVNEELLALVAELEQFVANNTDPTDADFDRVAERRHALIQQLHSGTAQDTGDDPN